MHPSTDAGNDKAPEPILALPSSTDSADDSGNTLTVGGASLALDHLGPIVVQPDGSLMGITDWETKTEQEKKTIARVIAKRNKERLEALQAAETAVAMNGEMD
ncbi:unnamed protein product [Aphanomyces euteiches]